MGSWLVAEPQYTCHVPLVYFRQRANTSFQQKWPGIKEPGGPCLSRNGTRPRPAATCLTRTASAWWWPGSSSTSSGARTTSTRGSSASSPPSASSLSGRLSATLRWCSTGSGTTTELVENILETPSKTSLETLFPVLLDMSWEQCLLPWSSGGSAWSGSSSQRFCALST